MGTVPNVLSPVAELEAWGDLAKKSGVVPPHISREQAMAIVQTGRELGLQPFQSLRSMSFINGKLTMSVQLQLALAKRQGVRLLSLTESADSCTVTLRRGDEKIACTYTVEDARKAGLVKIGGAWEKYGRQMLRWRAIGDALRLIAPDLVLGLLDPVEAESIEPEGEDIGAPPDAPPPDPPETPPTGGPGAPQGDDAAEDKASPAPPAEPVTEAQLKKIHAAFNALGITSKDARRRWIAMCLNRTAVSSTKDISKAEASVVIDALEEAIAKEHKGAA